MNIGIDAGGTLTKIVVDGEERDYKVFKSSNKEAIAKFVNHFEGANIYLTGGRQKVIAQLLNESPKGYSVEFDATFNGLKQLLSEQYDAMDRFIFCNIGTGSSYHLATDHQQRVGGSGVGGGLLMGLGYLLTGEQSFESLVRCSKSGHRDLIDLTVGHIYEGQDAPIPKDLTAANFGRVLDTLDEDVSKEDHMASVMGLIAETICTIGIHMAEMYDCEEVVYIGSTLQDNEVMLNVLNRYTNLRGKTPVLVENGSFAGALGCITSES